MEEMTGKGKNDASCAAHISYIHPLSIVDEGSDIGSGTRVWAGAHVMTGAKIGQDCNIGEHCFVEGGVTIGDRVTVKNNVALYCGAVIEDDVFLGPSCVFTNVINPRAFVSRKSEFRKNDRPQGGKHRSKCDPNLRSYGGRICFCWCRGCC